MRALENRKKRQRRGRLIRRWMEERLKKWQPVVSGLLQKGQLFFPGAEGSKEAVMVSPTAIYYGELSSPEELNQPPSNFSTFSTNSAISKGLAIKSFGAPS